MARRRAASEEEGGRRIRRFAEETFVAKIYESILSAIESGANVGEVVSQYMPLLLNEIDSLTFIYPYIMDLFVEVFNAVWDKRFKGIPRPVIHNEDSAVSAMAKVLETLRKYSDRLEDVGVGMSSVSSLEIEHSINYAAATFMECVCRHVFRLIGVIK